MGVGLWLRFGQDSATHRTALAHGRWTSDAVDIPSVWIDTARKRLKKYPNVDFKFGDIATLDIEDGAYDVSCHSFCLAPRRQKRPCGS